MRRAIIFAATLLLTLLTPHTARAVTNEAASLESSRSALQYAQTDARMVLQQFDAAGDQISLTVTLERNGQTLEKHAELTAFLSTFDDGTTAVLASESGNPELKVEQVRIEKESHAIGVTLLDQGTGNCYSAEFTLEASDDIATSVDELFNTAMDCSKDHALEMLSIGSNDSNAEGYKAFGSIVHADINDVTPIGSFTGWKGLIDALNQGKTVSLSSYNVDKNFFLGGGWHHENVIGTASYTTIVYSKPSGAGRYLFQIGLADIRRNTMNLSPQFIKPSASLYHGGGCIGEYDSSTNTCNARYYNMPIEFYNVTVGLGGLTNGACFVDCESSVVSMNGNSLALLNTFLNPNQPISNLINLLGSVQTGSNSVPHYFGQRTEQLAKGGLVRSIGTKLTNGRLRDNNSYNVSVSGNMDKSVSGDSHGLRADWSFESAASI